jgi:radical SAM protein with 4Fe4S-binding SPASM domain
LKIHYQELRDKQRSPLAESAPIDTPWLVMLDPANLCNMRCNFCPTGFKEQVAMRRNGIMPFDLYKKIIEDFSVMPHRIRKMVFCKDGEPLLNKHIVEMLGMAVDAQISDKIWLRTNGLQLKPDLNTKLAGLGLDLIAVSVKAMSAEGYKKIADVNMNYDKFLENVHDLTERCRKTTKTAVYVNTVNLHSPEDSEKFFRDFEGISDYVALEDVHNWSMSELHDWKGAGRVVDNVLVPRVACAFPLYSFAVNWNGEVSACQEDWAMRNIIGDLMHETVREIWRGETRRNFMRTHLEGRRSELPACAHCSYIEFAPANIDADREALLKVI